MRLLISGAVCLVAMVLLTLPAAGQIEAKWLSATTDDWANAARWSTNPNSPNNVGGNTYTATIDAAGSAYTVSIDTPFTIDSLTLNSASATIKQTSVGPTPEIVLLTGLNVEAGSYLLGVGSVTTPMVSGAGLISFDQGNIGSTIQPTANGTLTIAANTVIHTLTGSGTLGRTDGTVVNNGTLVADKGAFLQITGDHWVNNGTIKVDGGAFNLNGIVTTAGLGTFTNTGMAGGGLYLGGTIDNTGATLALTPATGSLVMNSFAKILGGTISGSGGNAVTVPGGTPTIDGVTVAGSGLAVKSSGMLSVVNGLTLDNGIVQVGDTGSFAGVMQFSGTQTLGGTGEVQMVGRSNVKPSSGTLTIGHDVIVRSKVSIGALGDVNFGLVNQGAIVVDATSQSLTVTGSTFENQGTVSIAGGTTFLTNINNTGSVTLTGGTAILSGAWHNGGTVTTTNATLELGGTFSLSDLGTINRTGGTVRVSGTMDLGGGTLALGTSTGSWQLTYNGRLKNGTITTANNAILDFSTGTPGVALDNITLGSDLSVPYSTLVTVYNGLTLANKTLTINGTNSIKPTSLTFSGDQTLGGTGQVVLNGPYGVIAPAAGTLTIGPGVTIHTLNGGGTVGATGQPVINKGTINADSNNNQITLTGSTVTNLGTIKSTTGAYLTINNLDNQGTITAGGFNFTLGGTWHNSSVINTTATNTYLGGTFAAADLGAFSRIGGNFYISGQFDNTGNTLNFDDAFNGPVTLVGQIKGGELVGSTASPLVVSASGAGQVPVLDGVTVSTNIAVHGGSEWHIRNGLTISASHTALIDESAKLFALNDQTIAGGELQFSQLQSTIDPAVNKVTLAAGTTIRTTGATGGVLIGNANYGSIVNNGLIVSGSSGGYVSLVGNFTNLGTIRLDSGMLNLGGTDLLDKWGTVIRNGGSINLVGILNNAGKTLDLNATPVGEVNIGTGGSILGGTITASGGRIPQVLRAVASIPDPVVFNNVTVATSLDVRNALINTVGTLTLSGNPTIRIFGETGTTCGFNFFGGNSIDGAGTITFAGSSTLPQISTLSTLNIGPQVVIQSTAADIIGTNAATSITNQGMISAAAGGKTLTVSGTLTNTGTMELRNGGTLSIQSTTITNLATNTLTGGNWAVYAGSTMIFNNKTITTNAASVTLDGVSSTFAAISLLNVNSGSFAIDHGRNFTTAGALTNSGTLLVGQNSTLSVAGMLINTGQIEGLGTIVGNVDSSGTVSPGESPGMLRIIGNFTQSAEGILDIQIKGPNPGTDYDVLTVTGKATVGGTLRLTLLNGYVPPTGASFSFLQSPTSTISFDEVLLPDNVDWDTAALANGKITAVPEPAMAIVVPVVVIMMLMRRRRFTGRAAQVSEYRDLWHRT